MMQSMRAKQSLTALLRGSIPEDQEQMGLFELIQLYLTKYPVLALAHHIPNGGRRGKAEAGRLKAMGVKPGVCDFFLPSPRRGFAGLYIELKRADGKPADVRKEQRCFIAQVMVEGFHVAVCYGAAEAWKVILWYITGARTITMGVDRTDKMP